jgi:type II secretory pathway pseudopilin PulG
VQSVLPVLILKMVPLRMPLNLAPRSKKDKKIMTKLSAKMSASLKKYRDNIKAGGFSMLEAVVVVGVLLALAVGGFIAYGKITENAKKASTESAASSVYTAILAAEMDGDSTTDPFDVIADYNASQDVIVVSAVSGSPTAVPVADGAGVDDATLVVTATNDGITATRG